MEKKFRDQLLTESRKKEEEIENVNLEIEERATSERKYTNLSSEE